MSANAPGSSSDKNRDATFGVTGMRQRLLRQSTFRTGKSTHSTGHPSQQYRGGPHAFSFSSHGIRTKSENTRLAKPERTDAAHHSTTPNEGERHQGGNQCDIQVR